MYKFKIRNGYNLKRLITQYGFYELRDGHLMYKKYPSERGLAIAVNQETREVILKYRDFLDITYKDQKETANATFAKLIKNKVVIIKKAGVE